MFDNGKDFEESSHELIDVLLSQHFPRQGKDIPVTGRG
jgi:hypothetical protein